MNGRTIVFGALSSVLCLTSLSAPAQAAILQGSDTLEVAVQNLIKICEQDGILTAGALSYIGGGSDPGENGMKAASPTQSIAPMSRKLTDTATDAPPVDLCNGADQAINPHQLAIARDALVLVTKGTNFTNTSGATQCDNLRNDTASVALNVATDRNNVLGFQVPGGSNGPAAAGTYAMTDWRDILKVAYFGIHHNNIDGSTPAADCNSDVRWELLNDFRNLSNNAADCSGASCGVVTHLWRTDDVSGTTDVFKALVGVSGNAQFCNGNTVGVSNGDERDNDPIRRPCQGTPTAVGADQVCGCDGKIGVVQAVTVPAGYTAAQLYNMPLCGNPRLAAESANTAPPPKDPCLNWTTVPYPSFGAAPGLCILPVTNTFQFGCRWASVPIPLSACDNRVWNLEAREPVFGKLLVNPDDQRQVLNAVFRIRPECQFMNAAEQIGCLAANYRCSAGFAGMPALAQLTAAAFKVTDIAATEANVHQFLDTGTGYRLSRVLFISSIAGFSVLAGSPPGFDQDQSRLVEQCAKDPARLQSALTGVGAYSGLQATPFFGASGAGNYFTQNVACVD